MSELNPCTRCGACCAAFRVSFYWGETMAIDGESPLLPLTEKLNDFLVCMKGTHQKQPRCIALEGTVGQQVFCRVYAHRASTCREVDPDGHPDSQCSRARRYWQLPPLYSNPVSLDAFSAVPAAGWAADG